MLPGGEARRLALAGDGTQSRPFGTAADGEPVEFTGIAVWEVRDGRLAHNWVERSAYELFRRLTSEGGKELRP